MKRTNETQLTFNLQNMTKEQKTIQNNPVLNKTIGTVLYLVDKIEAQKKD